MKFLFFLALLTAAVHATVLVRKPPPRSSITKRQVTSPPGFVTSRNGRFELDGKPFNFVATTAYYLPQLNELKDITATLTSIKAQGLKVVRVWGFNDVEGSAPAKGTYFQLWQNGKPTLNEGPNGLQKLDFVMDEAERLGLYIQLVLTNNWVAVHSEDPNRARGVASNDYGGMDTYVRQIVGPQGTHDQFYTSEDVKTAYKNYVTSIVNRYKAKKSVFSWEVANDPRCQSTEGNTQATSKCSASLITLWAADIASHIKTLDPNHMTSSGDGGFYCLDCIKHFAPTSTTQPPPVTSPNSKKRSSLADMPKWKRIKGNGPWTKAALMAKRVEEEKALAQKSRNERRGATAPRIRGRWAAPQAYKFKFANKRQDGSDTRFGPSYDGTFGVDTDDISAIPSLDFSTFQYFPDQNTYSNRTETPGTTDANLPFEQKVQRGLDWIDLHAESSRAANKPSSFNGFGLVGQDSSNSYTRFNSSNPTGQDTQQQYANTTQQATAYTSWTTHSIQQGINGVLHYSWGQKNLTSEPGTAVDDTNHLHPVNDSNGYSPDDGYASYSSTIQSVLSSAASLQNQLNG